MILSKGKSENSIKQALFEGRTVVWFKNNLIGLENNLLPLLNSSLSIKSLGYQAGTTILEVLIENKSDAKMMLRNFSEYTLSQNTNFFEIDPQSKKIVEIKTIEELKIIELIFSVENAFIAPKKNAQLSFKLRI